MGSELDKVLFVEVVRAAPELPEKLKAFASFVTSLERTQYDATYLDFLAEQIELEPRGKEWTDVLRQRKENLAAYCGLELLRGRVSAEGVDYTVRIDPINRRIIHWEMN